MSHRAKVESRDYFDEAAIDRLGVHKWLNDKTVGTTDPTVLSDTTLYYNLEPGETVLIKNLKFGVNSLNDNCHFEIGWTTGTAGSSTFTALMGHYEFTTGAANTGRATTTVEFPIPPAARYSDGARSVTIRATANDVTAVVSCGWCGVRYHIGRDR